MRLLIAEYDKLGEHMKGNKTLIIERDNYTRTEIQFTKNDDGYTCTMTEAQMMLLQTALPEPSAHYARP
jgi:hypothetical protein